MGNAYRLSGVRERSEANVSFLGDRLLSRKLLTWQINLAKYITDIFFKLDLLNKNIDINQVLPILLTPAKYTFMEDYPCK